MLKVSGTSILTALKQLITSITHTGGHRIAVRLGEGDHREARVHQGRPAKEVVLARLLHHREADAQELDTLRKSSRPMLRRCAAG